MTAPTSAARPLRLAVFLDRDGVVNLDHGYVGSIDRFELVPGAADAVRCCREAGFLTFVVTNQSGVARGMFDEQEVAAVHDHMRRLLGAEGAEIDDIRVCPHHVDGTVERYRQACDCRKPMPGMILDLAREWGVDLGRSFLVGDKDTDLAAARAAGVPGHLFTGGNLLDFVGPILKAPRPVLAS